MQTFLATRKPVVRQLIPPPPYLQLAGSPAPEIRVIGEWLSPQAKISLNSGPLLSPEEVTTPTPPAGPFVAELVLKPTRIAPPPTSGSVLRIVNPNEQSTDFPPSPM